MPKLRDHLRYLLGIQAHLKRHTHSPDPALHKLTMQILEACIQHERGVIPHVVELEKMGTFLANSFRKRKDDWEFLREAKKKADAMWENGELDWTRHEGE